MVLYLVLFLVWEWDGGTILILCLSLFLGFEQHVAQGANLVFFVPTSIVSIFTNIKQGLVKWKIGLIVGAFGIIRCTYSVLRFQFCFGNEKLKLYFGIFLLIIAVSQIFSLWKKNKKLV